MRKLIGKRKSLRILEPFCGTGRILIPLVSDGHNVVGLDRAKTMLDRAWEKVNELPYQTQCRIKLRKAEVMGKDWPKGFDIVVLGGNCLYELATSEEQEKCIAWAAASLIPGGFVFLDNDHMEGTLHESWQRLDIEEKAFPSGICIDGTTIHTQRERIWFDIAQRLVRYRRRTKITYPDGKTKTVEYLVQCHPPSVAEMIEWLDKYGFIIEQIYGDRYGSPYKDTSDRAIIWAKQG